MTVIIPEIGGLEKVAANADEQPRVDILFFAIDYVVTMVIKTGEKRMNTVELIYQESKDLPEAEAREVLDFVAFLKAKRQHGLENPAQPQHRGSDFEKADMSEFDQFGSVYDGHFDRDACYDRLNLR